MADELGTWNYIKFASVVKRFVKATGVSTDQALNSITLPNITGTIKMARANLNIVSLNTDGGSLVRLENAQSIQVKESVAGSFIDGVTLPDDALETHSIGAGTYYLPGSIDVIAQVASFNKTYDFQWNDLDFEGDGVDLSVIVELEIWFTIDSGVEAKIDAIDTEVGVIDGIVDTILSGTVSDTGAVVADGGNTALTFKTDLTSAVGTAFTFSLILFTSGTLTGQVREITGYSGGSKFITVEDGFWVAPSAADAFVIIPDYGVQNEIVQNQSFWGGQISNEVSDIYDSMIVGSGTVGADGSTTVFQTDLSGADDFWNNMQILFISATNNEGQVRRISDFTNVNGVVTVSEAMNGIAKNGDTFVIIGRYTGASSSLTPASIALAVWSEVLPGAFTGSQAGKIIADIGTRVLAFFNKLPSKSYLRGTADADGGFDTEDKADINAEADQAFVDYDPPTRTEATTDKDEIIAEVDANEVKIDTAITDIANLDADLVTHDTDMKALLGTPAGASIAADIAANLVAITSIQNNTRFTSAAPEQMQKPDSGNRAFRWTGNLYDTDGNMEDPASNEILVRVLQSDGTPITANLFKENALTNPLANATDQANFPSGSGWRSMERLGVGRYDLFYKVADSETEEALTIEFGWDEASVIMSQYRATAVVDYAGDIEDIQAKMDAVYVKTDAATPSPTIPAQIVTHDTDIKSYIATHDADIKADILQHDIDNKGLQRVKACPDLMYVPAGRTQIDLEGGITDVATEIPVVLSDNLLESGIVKIESEYVIYDGITDSKLQVTSRGAYGTSNVAHADGVVVSQSILFPLRLTIKDNEGNMKAPDSAPTVEIDDWNGTQELAPTAMTLISTGLYGYNYIIDNGELPENKIFTYTTVVDSITAVTPHEVVIIDQIASSNDVAEGGLGEFVIDQDGWYDNDGIKHLWTDVMKGFVKDADTGAPLDDAYVTAYVYENGETKYNGRPPGQARTRPNGTWLMYLDAGEYTFVVQDNGFRIVGDGIQNRTVG